MPIFEHDLALVLDEADYVALLDARINERKERIRANKATCRASRKAPDKRTRDDQDAATTQAAVAAFKAAFDARKAEVKTRHGVTATPAAEEFDPILGQLILRAQLEVPKIGKAHLERKRVWLSDLQADAAADLYSQATTASDEEFSLLRQVQLLEAVEVRPEPPAEPVESAALVAARAALEAQEAVVHELRLRLDALVGAALKDEPAHAGFRIDLAAGEVVVFEFHPQEG